MSEVMSYQVAGTVLRSINWTPCYPNGVITDGLV